MVVHKTRTLLFHCWCSSLSCLFFHRAELTTASDFKTEGCRQYGSQLWYPKICWCCRSVCVIRHMADFAIYSWKPWLALFLLSLAFVMVCCKRFGDRTDAFVCCDLLLPPQKVSEIHSTSWRGEGRTSDTVIGVDVADGGEYDKCTGIINLT